MSSFYQWRKNLAAESEDVNPADCLLLHVTDSSGHIGDWQIELVLPSGVTLHMDSTACAAGHIMLYTDTIDMRKYFDGLAALVQGQLGMRAQLGDWFVFINRRRT